MISRLLLWCGTALPFVYFAALVVAGALTRGFDHMRQLPSELGQIGAPATPALIANVGFIATGVCAIAGALGLFLAFRSRVVIAVLMALSLALFGVSMAMAGIFPLPNPLHYGFMLTLCGVFTPLFGAIALTGGARWVAALGFVLTMGLVAMSLSGLVTDDTAGLWARTLAAVSFSTIAYLCVRARAI